MSIHRTAKSGLFLTELVIIILFFAITSAICASLFVNAHLTSTHSKDLNMAVIHVQSAAESVKNTKGDTQKLIAQLGAAEQAGQKDTLTVYYDKDWNQGVAKEQAVYQLQVIKTIDKDGMLRANVAINKDEKLLYSVEVKLYVGK